MFSKVFRCLFVILFLLCGIDLASQTKVDSLLRVIERSKEPDRAKLYCNLAWEFMGKDYEKFYQYANEGLKIASKHNNQYYKAFSLRQVGIYYDIQGDAKKSVIFIDSALAINRKINDEGGIIACLSSLGVVQYNAGNYEKALPYYIESLDYYEKKNDLKYQAYFAGNIGGIYRALDEMEQAKKYYKQAVALAEKSGNKKSMGIAYNNFGSQLMVEKNYEEAEKMLTKSLLLKEELNESQGISYTLHSLAELYDKKKDYKNAKLVAERILKLNETTGDKKLQIFALEDLGDVHLKLLDTTQAEKYFLQAYKLSKETENMQTLSNAAYSLALINNGKREYKKALDYYAEYTSARDSVFKTEKFKSINEMQSKYESEKKEQQIALLSKEKQLKDVELLRSNAERMRKMKEYELLNKEKEMNDILLQKSEVENKAKAKENEMLKMDQKMQQSELARIEAEKKQASELSKRRTQQLYGMIAVSGLVVVMLFLIYRGYRQKQKANTELTAKNELINQQKKEVEHQKEIVDEKNKEITDSINYAKRLQEAILPPISHIKEYLPEIFIYYKPKDIVAGDFYWMHVLEDQNGLDKEIIIAAADCTGHGVPGAMVSVVCSNALNRTVKEFGITEPGKILDRVRELVIETFQKSASEVKDGMDISLTAITVLPGGNCKLKWAGANNPLWYISKNEDGAKELKELKANKQPIGTYAEQTPFTTHELILNKQDVIYMFTDGYADQFGGTKGKKFKYKQLEQLILENSQLSMEDQENILSKSFDEWKGKIDQIDDVCVIGVRL
ncbi:MAG: tetratricopeptide repeat protein [Bacteroidota bacterium]|nr:tetratricopeptide repeat protein [Bacteroidota bacterium]